MPASEHSTQLCSSGVMQLSKNQFPNKKAKIFQQSFHLKHVAEASLRDNACCSNHGCWVAVVFFLLPLFSLFTSWNSCQVSEESRFSIHLFCLLIIIYILFIDVLCFNFFLKFYSFLFDFFYIRYDTHSLDCCFFYISFYWFFFQFYPSTFFLLSLYFFIFYFFYHFLNLFFFFFIPHSFDFF